MTMLSIVIPAYNEENGISEIIERVLSIRSKLPEVGVDQMELIVVDDGSRDRTVEIVAMHKDVRLIRHAKNGGYGAALKTGFAAAIGEWIGFLDADGTYPPESFPALYSAVVEKKADIVIGSRMTGAESHMPFVRRVGNLIFANLVSLISAQRITDSASGMRIFRKSDLARLYPLPDGLNLTPVMSTRALHEKMNMIEVPITYSERVGRSKLSVVRDGIRFAQSIVETALNYNPVRPLGLLGLGGTGIAGLIALWLIWQRLQGVTSLSAGGAFSLFLALILAVAGISILALGLSFNYFVGLFHKTPIRQGLFGQPILPNLEQHFGWIGLTSFAIGVVLGIGGLILGMQGMEVGRLWFYYLISASFCLVGIQLVIARIQIQVLETLSQRERLVADDLRGKEKFEVPSRNATEIHAQAAD